MENSECDKKKRNRIILHKSYRIQSLGSKVLTVRLNCYSWPCNCWNIKALKILFKLSFFNFFLQNLDRFGPDLSEERAKMWENPVEMLITQGSRKIAWSRFSSHNENKVEFIFLN